MCDYSLHAIPNRLATEGERLVVHRFATGTVGLAPAPEISATPDSGVSHGFWRRLFASGTRPGPSPCAVCIPPGALLVLHGIPARLRRRTGSRETEAVLFTQVTAIERAHRDAVRFRSGAEVLLQDLDPGQIVEVLMLSSVEESQPENIRTVVA